MQASWLLAYLASRQREADIAATAARRAEVRRARQERRVRRRAHN